MIFKKETEKKCKNIHVVTYKSFSNIYIGVIFLYFIGDIKPCKIFIYDLFIMPFWLSTIQITQFISLYDISYFISRIEWKVNNILES